jgi:hypothetical protein
MIAFLRACRWSRVSFVVAILAVGCHPTRGCVESEFNLSPESRVPRWFKVPADTPRSDVDVVLSYYMSIAGSRSAVVTLRTRQGYRAEVAAAIDGSEPKTLVPQAPGELLPYPVYEVLRAHGITEIIEHRQRGSTFYVSDDPDVRSKLGVNP